MLVLAGIISAAAILLPSEGGYELIPDHERWCKNLAMGQEGCDIGCWDLPFGREKIYWWQAYWNLRLKNAVDMINMYLINKRGDREGHTQREDMLRSDEIWRCHHLPDCVRRFRYCSRSLTKVISDLFWKAVWIISIDHLQTAQASECCLFVTRRLQIITFCWNFLLLRVLSCRADCDESLVLGAF